MAIRIISDKPDESVVKNVICRNCGVTLEYVPNDIKTKTYRDISSSSDSYDYIDCLKCHKVIKVTK